MHPDLEVVQIRSGESFKAWSHGYPFHTVRWHFHPEYEIHQVVATSGRYFVGDFIGEFEPGNLVLTGPNLPHNWVSDVPQGDHGSAARTHHPVQRVLHRQRSQRHAGTVGARAAGRGVAPRRAVPRQHQPTGRADDDGDDAGAGHPPPGTLHVDRRRTRARRRHQGARQFQLSAGSVWLHVGRDQQGARLYPRQPHPAISTRPIWRPSPGSPRAPFREHSGGIRACRSSST